MSHPIRRRRSLTLAALACCTAIVALALPTAAPAASKAGNQIDCRGTADFCGAVVPIGGGASNRPVTIQLTGTGLRLVARYVIPASSRGAYSITNARLRGTRYTFTLNAVQGNPRRARIVLLFAAGVRG